MPRAAGPFKILEKINDNAYKLELPPEFGVSPIFNISDLKPYLGEEDELESRMTPIQQGEDDDRVGVPDLSVSGDKFDLVEDDPHDPTTTSEPEAPMQSLNQLTVVNDLVDARSA
jgi:hypothetical protein